MPVLADMTMAQEVILPALQRSSTETLKIQGLLEGNLEKIQDIRVDNFHDPNAVMLKSGLFYSLYAAEEDLARHLLGELAWNWSRPQGFAALPEAFVPLVAEHATVLWQNPCWQYHLPLEVPLPSLREHRGPSCDQLMPPTTSHVPQILEHWPYGDENDPRDHVRIASRIDQAPASGWYEDGELVSWALINEDLSLGLMHTLEGFRRQGIGMKVLADLTLKACHQNWTPYCYVVDQNQGPVHLLEELGYVRSDTRYVWLETAPH